MFSICQSWSRIPQNRGGNFQYQSLSQVTTRSTKWKLFKTVQSIPIKQMDTFQGYIIWLYGKVTWKKRIPGNLLWLSFTSGRCSTPSIRTTQRNRQRHQHPWTLLYSWPSQQSSSPQNESKDNRQDTLRSTSSKATRKRQQKKGNKEEVTRRNSSQYGFRAKSWQETGDLSPWCKERWEACSGSLTISSSTSEEPHNTLFWPSSSLSKSLIIQVSYYPNFLSFKSFIDQTTSLLSPLLSVFLSLSLVQVGRFFHR